MVRGEISKVNDIMRNFSASDILGALLSGEIYKLIIRQTFRLLYEQSSGHMLNIYHKIQQGTYPRPLELAPVAIF